MSTDRKTSDSNKNSILEDLSILSDDKKSKSSKSHSTKNIKRSDNKYDIKTDDITLSQLEIMANKKKIKKNSEKSEEKRDSSVQESQAPKTSSYVASSSSESIYIEKEKKKERNVLRENRNDMIRREKSELLYKFSKLNLKGKWSSLKLDMNNSLDEIKNEYERVKNEIQNERSVAFLKRMLLLGVQGVEMLNTRFDPVGVDLDGWSEAMGYSLENQEYDEVLAELYEKYKGSGNMSPEVKFIFMIISSATMFTISKKITKLDSSNGLVNMIGNILGKSNNDQQQTQYMQQQQTQYMQQQQTQYMPQTQYVPQQQTQYMPQKMYSEPVIPNPYDLQKSKNTMTETSDDNRPSKLQRPNNNIIGNDKIDIENILKTMNERKKEKKVEDQSEITDELFRDIHIKPQKKGRGRPRKGLNMH